ncbi:MAG: 2-C-methyl-D-erythritol 2,4-cyclodiphosphate synthase [Candidatus Atribacteria bacterium]|nr:2-C-methyl-D-erythritol 2,4-cyclodiphosphate synthase [Candidatus Atribacteria bacterium]
MACKVGVGYDIHSLVGGIPLVLGGVSIPFEKGLSGHSDGDVLCHAIMDSLLGAAALPDIGYWFPTNDESIRGARSLLLLEEVIHRVREGGWEVGNIDATVIAEFPRISPYVMEMKNELSHALGVPVTSIGIKATTNEQIGSIGKGEGIACISVCLIWKW